MPPKTVFAKNDVVKAAFVVVQEQGIKALTAREVALLPHFRFWLAAAADLACTVRNYTIQTSISRSPGPKEFSTTW